MKPKVQVSRPKKPYSPPVVHVYGDVQILTQSAGKQASPDGGKVSGFTMTKV